MLDIAFESLRVAAVAAVFFYFLRFGRESPIALHRGWRLVRLGFGLLLLGSVVDVTDNFESLNRYVVVGDTAVQAFIEKVIGSVGGSFALVGGLRLWLPRVESSAVAAEGVERELGRYTMLFEAAPNPMWEEDFSQAAARLDELRAAGVVDLRRHLTERPEELDALIESIAVVDVNEAAIAMVEADSKDELLGGFPRGTLTSDAREALLDQLVGIWHGHVVLEGEYSGVTLAGRPIRYELRWRVPVAEGAADLSRVIVAITDMTDRYLAESALRVSEERYRSVLEAIPVAVLEQDWSAAKGRLATLRESGVEDLRGYLGEHPDDLVEIVAGVVTLNANQAASRMLGVEDHSALLGPLSPARVTDRSRGHFVDQLEAIWEGRGFFEAVYATETYEGEELWLQIGWADTAYLPGSDLATFVVAASDVTEARALERSKDELIASVSHELRTPLTAVTGFARLLADDGSALSVEERHEMIEAIASQGMDLTNIIEDLLTAARSEAGVLTVDRLPIDLMSEVERVVEVTTFQSGRDIELRGSAVLAAGDPARVRQILRNLVSNAFKYGGDRIWIEVTGDETAARVRVCDDGSGVSEAERERIFEPYQRAHSEPGRTSSIGMGLTISRQLAWLMAGDLTYARRPGESVFELTLPGGRVRADRSLVSSA